MAKLKEAMELTPLTYEEREKIRQDMAEKEKALEEIEEAAREFVRELTAQDVGLFQDGRERVSSIPVAPPVGYERVPSMFDHMRTMIKSEMLRQAMGGDGMESFEEADDFDVDDDDLQFPQSPYETVFHEEVPYAVPRASAAAEPPPTGEPKTTSNSPSLNPSPGTASQGGAGGTPPASDPSALGTPLGK